MQKLASQNEFVTSSRGANKTSRFVRDSFIQCVSHHAYSTTQRGRCAMIELTSFILIASLLASAASEPNRYSFIVARLKWIGTSSSSSLVRLIAIFLYRHRDELRRRERNRFRRSAECNVRIGHRNGAFARPDSPPPSATQ